VLTYKTTHYMLYRLVFIFYTVWVAVSKNKDKFI